MNNTEIFELCENSSKQQCLECHTYWEIGIIYCSCGRNMKSIQSPTEFDLNNRDVTSIRNQEVSGSPCGVGVPLQKVELDQGGSLVSPVL